MILGQALVCRHLGRGKTNLCSEVGDLWCLLLSEMAVFFVRLDMESRSAAESRIYQRSQCLH